MVKIKGKDQIDCSIRRCTYGSKKRIYDAEYGYDMNKNVCYNSGRDHIYIFYTCRRYHWDRGS